MTLKKGHDKIILAREAKAKRAKILIKPNSKTLSARKKDRAHTNSKDEVGARDFGSQNEGDEISPRIDETKTGGLSID